MWPNPSIQKNEVVWTGVIDGHTGCLVMRNVGPAERVCSAAPIQTNVQGAMEPRHGSPGNPAAGLPMQLTAKEVLMTRLALASLLLALSVLPLYAQSALHTDQSGYTTGTQDGRSVNTYTDRYGNTTGWVGGKYQNTYSDGYGGTTGTLGNKRINTYDDGYGNTTGTIGRDRINLHTDPSGVTTGTVGQRRLNCYSNRFSTTCY